MFKSRLRSRDASGTHRARSRPGPWLLCIALSLSTASAAAQPSGPGAFSFLRIEPSARAAAMGGAFSAVADGDVNAFFYNPALVSDDVHRVLSLSYLNHVTDINAGFAAFGYQYRDAATLVAGIRYLNWGRLERTTADGERVGSFGAGNIALTVGGSRPAAERVRVGANLHFIHASVAEFGASALAADFGVAFHEEASRMVVSASVNNLGLTMSSLGETSEELPLDVRVAVAKRFANLPLLLSITGYNLHDFSAAFEGASTADNVFYHVALGGELQFSPAFNLRFGYNHRRHDELRTKPRLDFAGVGLGVGIRVRRFKFDYAYSSWSELGGLNQLTVGTSL